MLIEEGNVVFTWENITVEKSQKKWKYWKIDVKKKSILKGVSGIATSSNLIAVLGPSGAGKSTLLGAISGRIKGIGGTLKINGEEINRDCIRKISRYLYQDCMFIDTLTVQEHMKFVAALKRIHKKQKERNIVITKLLSDLSLESHTNKEIRILSGGERKRLALATELIDNPHILFCDEPTTGLDSFQALHIVKILDKLAKCGKIVITTIHQPSTQLFACFSNIVLISEGTLIFQGNDNELRDFFESQNLHSPLSYNPADFYMKCISENKVQPISKDIASSKMGVVIMNNGKIEGQPVNHSNSFSQSSRRIALIKQFYWLMWRDVIDMKRNINLYVNALMMRTFVIAILVISNTYVKIDKSDGVQNIQGILLLIVSELLYSSKYAALNVFPEQKHIFVREKSMYSVPPYVISKLLTLMPLSVVHTVLMLSPYFLFFEFFEGVVLYFSMFSILLVGCAVASSFGFSFSTLFPRNEYSVLLHIPIDVLLCVALTGIYIKITSLPVIFKYMKYISPFYYCFESLSILEWKDKKNLRNCTDAEPVPCFTNGIQVLDSFGFSTTYNEVFYNCIGLCASLILFSIIATIGLIMKRKNDEVL